MTIPALLTCSMPLQGGSLFICSSCFAPVAAIRLHREERSLPALAPVDGGRCLMQTLLIIECKEVLQIAFSRSHATILFHL
jgi:hypothetical protein